MGCLNSKEVSEQIKPYTKRKQSRWRCIVGLEAKGIEFNAQVGLVHVGNEKYDHTIKERKNPEPRPGNRDPYDTVN